MSIPRTRGGARRPPPSESSFFSYSSWQQSSIKNIPTKRVVLLQDKERISLKAFLYVQIPLPIFTNLPPTNPLTLGTSPYQVPKVNSTNNSYYVSETLYDGRGLV